MLAARHFSVPHVLFSSVADIVELMVEASWSTSLFPLKKAVNSQQMFKEV
jgi:hypothetical protein